MSSDNSTYEERIETRMEDGREYHDLWRECLIDRANLSKEMTEPTKWQAKVKTGKKPVGLYFDRLDWVIEAEEKMPVDRDPYPQRLEKGETTKPGSLIESFHHFGRGVCLAPEKKSDYDAVSVALVVETATNALKASELDVQEWVKKTDHASLKGCVNAHVEWFEEDMHNMRRL